MAASPLRILLVEDNFPTRRILRAMLEVHGACDIAVNGREAVQAVEAAYLADEPYHLICLDIMMPELDGRDALREIRQLEEARGIQSGDGCKVIMTTALGDAANVIGAFADQCDGYLVKPIEPQKLINELNRHGLLGRPPKAQADSPATNHRDPSEPAIAAGTSFTQWLAETALMFRP